MKQIKTPIRNYWNWRSKTYGYDADKSAAVASQWASALTSLVAESPGKKALDIGTGRGQFAFYLAGAGFEVTGIDLSDKMVELAGEYAREHHLDIDFQTMDAEHLKFEDHSFDVVVSRNLLWTLPDPGKALSEWRRVLKPGGRLVVSDGFWENTTWKKAGQVLFQPLKKILQHGSVTSTRFFCTYAMLQKKLPFYEGICFEDVAKMLKKARFRNIGAYDTGGFQKHPYLKQNNGSAPRQSQFFIAYAER